MGVSLRAKSLLIWIALPSLPWLGALAIDAQSSQKVDFAKEIAPVLKAKCVSCHNVISPSGGLRLDSLEAIRKGGDTGPLFNRANPKESLLLVRIHGSDGKPKMPMGFAPLDAKTVSTIQTWIEQGAELQAPQTQRHWAYIPPTKHQPPKTKAKSWPRNTIDSFILDRLEREGLKPSAEAPPESLARRAALDLTGLPPTVEQLDAFLNDRRPQAYERYVDRLLASSHYGEKMARTWMDLARYADTNGYEKDLPRSMWAWRDWVINAFNQNKPYDKFVVEQLAGDLLPDPSKEQFIATGFHRNSMLNDEGGIDAEEFRIVAVMDRVETTATTFMGTTLACAQCHDHKFDPLSQKDYYRFFAYFNQSQDNGRDVAPVLSLPNPDQTLVLDRIRTEIKKLTLAIGARTPKSKAGVDDWEHRFSQNWLTSLPEAKAEGATLTVLPDNSVLASGADPKADRYLVSLPLEGIAQLSGVRIEALPDPSLPHGSSGRNFNGNFVLHKVIAKLHRAGGSDEPVLFQTSKADLVQAGHNPMDVINDGSGLGWAPGAFLPENRTAHSIVLSTSAKVLPNDRLILELRHQTVHPNHNLGRFRVSVTADADLARTVPPPAKIVSILAKKQRTPADAAELATFYSQASPELSELRARQKRLQTQADQLQARAPTVMVLRELEKKRANRLLNRGDFRTPGERVEAGTPASLGTPSLRQDRLGLANWLVSHRHPLTARVQVNRLWEQCFGRGLVATPEDFGTQGDSPSHPELLDTLSVELMEGGWILKAMLRKIVTSATYRQSSQLTPAMAARDPNNVLLARAPRYRVEAESVRDIALAASGLLNRKIGGKSVMPPQPPGIWENSFTFYDTKDRWLDATGPNRYRRGLYTFWRRTAPYPMALTFDTKSRDMCVATRSRTNTPLQALNTLNDPTFVEAAGALALQLSQKGVAYGFRSVTSRSPKATDLAALAALRKQARARYEKDPSAVTALMKAAGLKNPGTPDLASWVLVASALLNLDEAVTRG